MRLTCPNCGAQYEVPAEVIPAEGRDVQCSNCGDTWFQAHADALTEAPEVETVAEPVDPELLEDTFDDVDLPEPEDEIDHAPETSDQQQLDPAVADILRQEAEYETRLRANDAGASLESQADLGLDDLPVDEAERRSREARDRMARMRGQDAEAETGSRRGLLPDIEEINSTLRASGEAVAPAAVAATAAAVPVQRSGFARGFLLIVILAILLVLLYIGAPDIAAAVPALEGPLQSYVAIVDQARVWLDGALGGIVPN
ncbi:MAG: zinc-ribbon domain-containing protein [Sedimentitalea sp.]